MAMAASNRLIVKARRIKPALSKASSMSMRLRVHQAGNSKTELKYTGQDCDESGDAEINDGRLRARFDKSKRGIADALGNERCFGYPDRHGYRGALKDGEKFRSQARQDKPEHERRDNIASGLHLA